ncbi:hypothetical protein [Thalassotalea marina]|uniref:DUF4760 domain-containing protein n=1 Tax=Thalassotalea marina TaxID=1673741 RepID=A0A919BRS2_9GAMM|nr:hypothetical protein [Thalassotalea marina]GHG08175.1 hypothetical protein GCM10017161_42430 [Thalassotalea marina]
MNFNWYALFGAVVVAAAAAIFAYYRYIQEQKHQRDTLLNSLFAEIANIYEHYTYAAHEIPLDMDDQFELFKRLRWSAYGNVNSTGDLGKLGFLSASNIKALIQLTLLIRNDDLLLDQLQKNKEDINQERLEYLRERFKMRIRNSENIITDLVNQHPKLKPVFEEVKRHLP